jgi:hypothetical protein
VQVREADGGIRADAAVAAGNALSTGAELAGEPGAAQLLGAACESYEMALAGERDAMTHSNLADALVSCAGLPHDSKLLARETTKSWCLRTIWLQVTQPCRLLASCTDHLNEHTSWLLLTRSSSARENLLV